MDCLFLKAFIKEIIKSAREIFNCFVLINKKSYGVYDYMTIKFQLNSFFLSFLSDIIIIFAQHVFICYYVL